MATITRVYRSSVPALPDDVFAWHASPAAFERLTPQWMPVRVIDGSGGIGAGDWKVLRVPVLGPAGFSWKLVHRDTVPPSGFVDVQEHGPFASWRHEHRFRPDGAGGTLVEDAITYKLPYGAAGQSLAGRRLERTLDNLFQFRHQRTANDLSRIGRAGLAAPIRVAVTGSSGLVGRRLVSFLRAAGHDVVRLVRHPVTAPDEIFWNPATSEIDAAALEGLDAVVHLAGVSIAGGRWTRARKDAILHSRLDSTHLLARTLAGLTAPPRVLVSTSAVGFYGDAKDRMLTEEAPAGSGFLAEVCQGWEAASRPADAAGIRVVNPRFGLVLAGDGGMLPLIAKAYGAGVGGPLGDGRQYMSWIAIDDLVGILFEAITNEALSGPVNAVAPGAVTGNEFAVTLGKVLRRPSFFRVPAAAMRLAAGELADELILASQRAVPARLTDVGFPFHFPTLEEALRAEMGRPVSSPVWGAAESRVRNQDVA